MLLEELQKHYRNSYDFELKTKMSHVNWINWEAKGYIPLVSQLKVERITKGFFKASFGHTPEGDK